MSGYFTIMGHHKSPEKEEIKSFIENLLEQEKEKSRKEQEKADWFGVTSRKMMKSEKEAIIEQERKRMSDEIGRLENDAEVVYSASGCDYSDHVDKESVLAIINKKVV